MYDQATILREKILRGQYSAKTIAVISGKGGVGKSNVVLNMALELQELGRKVLILDLDIGMGNIDVLLGLTSNHTILDLFNTNHPISDMIERGPKGLDFIAGASSLNELFQMDNEKLAIFLHQYQQLNKAYDYIFFDMGAGVTPTSLSFILAADECLLVTTPEPTAMTDAYSIVKHIFLHQENKKITVIMNRSSSQKEGRNALQRLDNVVQQFISNKINLLGILTNDPIVTTAVIRQTPYVMLKPNALISKETRNLAKQYDAGNSFVIGQESTFLTKIKTFFQSKGVN